MDSITGLGMDSPEGILRSMTFFLKEPHFCPHAAGIHPNFNSEVTHKAMPINT
jgi:hypothetical protein